MTAPINLDALNPRALAARRDVLAQLIYRDRGHDDRVSNEVRGLNHGAPRLRGLFVQWDETDRWTASSDNGVAEGRGALSLIATLADVPLPVAAAFLARLIPAVAIV